MLTGCLYQNEPNRFDYLNQFGSILEKEQKTAEKAEELLSYIDVANLVPIWRKSGANLSPLAAPFCEKRERCRKFDFGPTTGLPVTKKLVLVI